MFKPGTTDEKSTLTPEQVEAKNDAWLRRQALEHAVDLAKAGASRYGDRGYTSHTLLTYAADLTAFLKDGVVPADPNAPVSEKPKETDPAHAPGPETREWLKEPNVAPSKRKRSAK